MITIHHLNNSRPQRILWLLEELELPYEIRYYRRQKSMAAPDELKRIHPLGKSPILQDDTDHGLLTLVETGAICEYLVEKADGRFGPGPSQDEKIRYRQFLHYAEGSVMPVLFAVLLVTRIPLVGSFAAKKVRPLLDTHLDFIEQELSRRPWFAGDRISAADIMMSFPLEAAATRGGLGERYPAIRRWLEAIHARPAYRRALENGGPYSFAD